MRRNDDYEPLLFFKTVSPAVRLKRRRRRLRFLRGDSDLCTAPAAPYACPFCRCTRAACTSADVETLFGRARLFGLLVSIRRIIENCATKEKK